MTISKLLVQALVFLAITAAAGTLAACANTPVPTAPAATASTLVPTATTIRITGSVLDADGAPVAGVFMVATVLGSVVSTTGLTDAAGRFFLDPINLLSADTVVLSATKSGYAQYAALLTPGATPEIVLNLRLATLLRLPSTGAYSSTLLPSDPPKYVGEAYESDYAYQTRSLFFETPSDADLTIVLEWSHAGNADLRMWVADTLLKSSEEGGVQTIRIPRSAYGTLIVGQPYSAGRITQPVAFTVTTTRAR